MTKPAAAGAVPGETVGGAPSLLIVGCGLIGTSIGLAAAAAGWEVWLSDREQQAVELAVALGAGRDWGVWSREDAPVPSRRNGSPERIELAVVAVPPRATASIIAACLEHGLAATVMHVASVQTLPRRQLETMNVDLSQCVGTHPMAGRERAGTAGASAALFVDRPWIVCPAGSSAESLERASRLIACCHAMRVDMSDSGHDEAVALVSHLPQVVSSLLAGELADASPDAVTVAGTGIRDLTRLADADPALWTEILTANASAVMPVLESFATHLRVLSDGLGTRDPFFSESAHLATSAALNRGRRGRDRLGGKHGTVTRHWAAVDVVIPDRPGALLDIFTVCRDAGVNVEDLSVEHAPGQPVGVLQLQVDPSSAQPLTEALKAADWPVAGVCLPHE